MRDTSYDTVSGYTSNSTKQQLSGLNDPASQTALQVSEQLQRTKDGVGFLASVVLGAGGIAKTTKIDGKDVEVSTAGIGSRGELTKPYDPVQTRKDLEAVHGAENNARVRDESRSLCYFLGMKLHEAKIKSNNFSGIYFIGEEE